MKDAKTSSYFDFLKRAQNRQRIPAFEMKEIIMKKFDHESLNNDFFSSVFYLEDYIDNYGSFRPCNTNNFLGYTFESLLKADAAFLHKIRNQEDMKIFDEQIFPDQMTFLANHKHEKEVDYTFITNFRIKNYDNSWSVVVQRTQYLFNDYYKMPVASVNSLTDFTHFKSDSKINHLIEKHETNGEKSVVENKCYFPGNTKDILSKREVDVLKLASQGMGSKEIADQLNISIYTINNHRRNMLVRSNCKNILQLVDIAMKTGVL